MNKYSFSIPYDYSKYGNLKGTVYAESEEDALRKISDYRNRVNEEYVDSDDHGETNLDFSEAEVELDEEEVNSELAEPKDSIPSYFLAELYML
ncbi:MAG: hypothetical protein JST55_16455 [Bacteroidetes bacterium]|nr:hypothetical protein [Bacteroidota bacterium]